VAKQSEIVAAITREFRAAADPEYRVSVQRFFKEPVKLYALRAAELSDDANIWDTVIEAYLANGRKADALRVCREALGKHPTEQMLKDRLRQMEGIGGPSKDRP